MAVDLANLVESLKREVNPPGSDLFPEAGEDNYLGNLSDAFWELRLFGFLNGFTENAAARGGPLDFGENIITPFGAVEGYDDPDGYAASDLSREWQQLVVLWAAWKVALTHLMTLNTSFRVKAGPVEYETQNAASVLAAILAQLKGRIDFILDNLAPARAASTVAVLDSVIERTYSQAVGEVWWVR